MRAEDPAAPYARLAVVGLIREPGERRWLLTRPPRATEIWSPAGGRLERGESLSEAVVREMQEEVGLNVEAVGPCYAYVTMHKGERTVAVSMACRADRPSPPLVLASDEACAARWVTVEEWLDLTARGVTPWSPLDVVRATTLASTLLDLSATE